MKRIITLMLVVLLVVVPVIGCGNKKETVKEEQDESGKLKVVATIFPAYDWLREVAGDEIELTLLQSQGVDLHSYQPTVQDMTKISDCDLFVYVGGVSDTWVEGAIANAKNENIQTLNLIDVLGDKAKLEEVIEGMQEEEHDHEGDDHEEEAEIDEHIWLSLKNAQIITQAMSDKLSSMDEGNKEVYRRNLATYNEKLTALDEGFAADIAVVKEKTLIFGDRFPFRYLLDDYGIAYYAAFPGCSAETEASFETVIFLADKVDELGIKDVMVLENSNQKIAQSIVQNTEGQDAQIQVLNSLQSAVAEGDTYLSVMEGNLQILANVLTK